MSLNLLQTLEGCCTLTNRKDGSGPWIIHQEHDGEMQLQLLDEEGEVEDLIPWPIEGEQPKAHYVGKHMPHILRIDGEDYHITWTEFAGLYKDLVGQVWAIPNVDGVRGCDVGANVKAGNTYWLLLVGAYDPRVARLVRHNSDITQQSAHIVMGQAISAMPEELVPLFKEMQESGCVPCLIWKET